MSNVNPERLDIEDEESTLNFIRNLFWGQWVNNQFLNVVMVCGYCKNHNYITIREKDWCAACPCCERCNQFLPE